MNVIESLTFIYNGLGLMIGFPASATSNKHISMSARFFLGENVHDF